MSDQPTFTMWLRRREDLVDLRFEFYNLKVDASGPDGPRLVRANPAIRSSRMVVVFPPQHVAEEAIPEKAVEFNTPGSDEPLPPVGSTRARVAGETIVAFEVGDVDRPYTVGTLFDWSAFPPAVVEVAKVPLSPVLGGRTVGRRTFKPKLRKPLRHETQIELPWRLLLSPSDRGAWAHSPDAVIHNGRTELWHTRLGVRAPDGSVNEHDEEGRTLRAVWALDPDFPDKPTEPEPFTMSVTAFQRYQIVRATSDLTLEGVAPVATRRLMLSTLGGWLDSRGAWDLQGLSIEEWRHIATQGRDAYVRIVNAGYLFPFGHRASLFQVSERKFTNQGSRRVAFLRKRWFIIVSRPSKEYAATGSLGMPAEGRGFAFTQVRITTLVTPNLEPPVRFPVPNTFTGIDSQQLFMPMISKAAGDTGPLLFHMVGTDWAGNEAEFTSPVVFVDKDLAYCADLMAALVDTYNNATPADQKQASFDGQNVAIAQPTSPGNTTVEISKVRWNADKVVPPGPAQEPYKRAHQPFFWPNFGEADVRIGPAEQASGKHATVAPTIQIDPDYVTNPDGPGQVFARLTAKSPLTFGADRSGGVATPNFAISGLSRHLGPVGGDLSAIKGGNFTPGSYFQGELPKLLGALDLANVVEGTSIAEEIAPAAAPRLTYRTVGNELKTHLGWRPGLKADAHNVFQPANANGPASMTLDVTVVTHLVDQTKSTYSVLGDLRNFTLNLVDGSDEAKFLVLTFNRLTFTAAKGQPAHVDVDLANVEFAGVLNFVNQLRQVMAIGSGDRSPAIEVDDQGITARVNLPIPDLAVGVFALTNLKFAASLNIPFSGKPVRVRFAFSDRADTFLLQIAMFAGGGFFAIAIGADGVEQVEAALEFGASVSIDIGVASGGVYLLAGIYFSYGQDPDTGVETTVLTGFVKLGGELCVLEIVSLSLEFYMDLTYVNVGGNDKVVGTATLSVEVDVLIFSGTVECTVKKQFGDGDPSFQDQLPVSDLWDEYCDAFVAVP